MDESRRVWDSAAASFDDEHDHGLRDPVVRAAWTSLLAQWLPHGRARVLDVGCGTGSLSLILAELGHDVMGVDFSRAMIAQASAKASLHDRHIGLSVMDVGHLGLSPRRFDCIVCRHVLWALANVGETLQQWTTLLAPAGRLIVIEGFWHTGAGLHSADVVKALPAALRMVAVQNLSNQDALWGSVVTDERYMVIASLEVKDQTRS